VGGAYGRQGGIKEVLKLKERKIKVFFFFIKNKSSSFGHQRNTF